MKFLAYLICYLVYPFSFLFPRRGNRYAFGSFRGAFNDNAKYLYIWLSENCKNIDAAWLSTNKNTVQLIKSLGLKAYYVLSIRGALFALTSKYWFFNSYTSDIMFCLSGRAVCVNLWHGIGLKRTDFNTISGPMGNRFIRKKPKEVFFHPESFRRPDYLISSAPFQTSMFAKAFRIPESKCLEFGYPRNSILKMPDAARKNFISKYEPEATVSLTDRMSKYDKVFIYMPTWRDSQRKVFTQSMDLSQLNDILESKNALLLLKPHANTIVDGVSDFSNISLIGSNVDVYPLLPYTNVLITDYSSILYDYLIIPDKGVILYLYDYAEYINERDFYYPFDENVAGVRAHSFEELAECIRTDNYHIDADVRKDILTRFWGNSISMDSSAEIINYVQSIE